MAEITDPLLKLVSGKPTSLASTDTIAQSKITNLTTDLGTLTSGVSAAQADADQALLDAAAASAAASVADGKAVAAQADADQALLDAAAAQADADQALLDAAAASAAAAVADGKAVAAQADATQALSDAAAAQATADAALPKAGGTITGDLAVSGDLVVEGTIISKSKENVVISDSFLDLNGGNVITASATAGGLTVNVKASGAAETVNAFAAGVLSTSAPTLTMSASSAFAANDIIQISGAAEAKNNGLFVVGAGGSGSTVFLKGIGGSSVSVNTPFVQNQLESASGQTATATKVDLAVIAVSDGSLTKVGAVALVAGTWCFNYQPAATDAAFAASWIALEAVTVPSLEAVLVSGSMIGANTEIGFLASVASAAEKGSLLYQHSDGELKLLASSVADGELDAVALENGGADKKVASVLGQKVLVKVDGTGPSIGDLLYVSAVAGSATKVVPTAGRIIKIGKCVGAISGGLYPVIYLPQYIADISA
jgi:hypothetical protein